MWLCSWNGTSQTRKASQVNISEFAFCSAYEARFESNTA